ncbi:MAG: S8 family peptidase [Bacteroidales bacterium]|nr:S8 family peptidase [Bacteroidales bacterium]
MKKIILFLMVAVSGASAFSQSAGSRYYYHKGERRNLQISTQHLFIHADVSITDTGTLRRTFNIDGRMIYEDSNTVCFRARIPHGNYTNTLRQIKRMPFVVAAEPVVGDTLFIDVMRRFYVKLNSQDDSLLLQYEASRTGAEVVGKVPHCGNWYALQTSRNSTENSIELSNRLFETGFFANVDPGFVLKFEQTSASYCVSDGAFDEQWGMESIKACKAWKITTGDTSVRVAVIDGGIDTSHVEFDSLRTVFSHDILTDSSPARVYAKHVSRDINPTNQGFDLYHGIHVGGIIFANHNRDSVAGIAPNTSAIDISYSFPENLYGREKLAAAINLAVENRARVINNSWRSSYIPSDYGCALMEEAIDSAINRDCVVVFASGNANNSILNEVFYPARYRPEILAVGAVTFDNPYNASCYGKELDISAPGEDVKSAHNNNGYIISTGTSMAAAHVSGVAALMLSVNPGISSQEVRDIIEQTAQKITGENYYEEPDHNNGLWTDRVGYGVVDAHRSVLKAAYNKIQGDTTLSLCDKGSYTIAAPHNASIEGVSFFWSSSDNLLIESGKYTHTVLIAALGAGDGQLVCNVVHDGDTVSTICHVNVETTYPVFEDCLLSSSLSFPDTFLLAGTVVIDSASAVTWHDRVAIIAPFSRVVIRPGGKLVVDGGTLSASCPGAMWQGVEVMGHPGMRQLEQHQGSVELKNGATIENAHCAILAGLSSAIDTTTVAGFRPGDFAGGIVKATGAILRNNARGVHFMPFTNTSAIGQPIVNISHLTNCIFTTDGAANFTGNGCTFSEHILLDTVNGLLVSGCSFSNALPTSGRTSFRAILSRESGFRVTRDCPIGVELENCVCGESVVAYNLFHGFNTAIEACNHTFQRPVVVDQSRFRNVVTAVKVSGSQNATITRDTFEIEFENGGGVPNRAVHLEGCTGFKIEENYVDGGYRRMLPAIGMHVVASGSADNTLFRNTFMNLDCGVLVQDYNGMARRGLTVACASFTDVANEICLFPGATMKSTANITINNCESTLCAESMPIVPPDPILQFGETEGENADTTMATKYAMTGSVLQPLAVLLAYPNPTEEYLNMELTHGDEILSAVLLDSQGRMVGKAINNATIETGSLCAGVYILRVTGTCGKVYHRKIIKK